MRYLVGPLFLMLPLGCAMEPNWRNIHSSIFDGPHAKLDVEHQVSPILAYEEIPDYLDRMQSQGWELKEVLSAGPEFPARYLVVCRRFR